VWKGAQPDEFYTEDWHDPREMYEHGAEQVSDEDLREAFIVSADPDVHAERVREVEKLGATTVVLMNNSGADPHGAIRVYGERVLPALGRSPRPQEWASAPAASRRTSRIAPAPTRTQPSHPPPATRRPRSPR
jgi:alkanesulfonate monooxygenase SsuD/methylene tetrahydromethanopterin reductase-like flavin-dependent oxidoreductase (luciferase family)